MTTYFVDPKKGSDKKGDGLTSDTAFQTYDHAVDVSRSKDLKNLIETQIAKLPLWRRLVWPRLTKNEFDHLGDLIIVIPTKLNDQLESVETMALDPDGESGGTWQAMGMSALVRCPNQGHEWEHYISLKDHRIDSDGRVYPIVECDGPGCIFVAHIKLEDWVPGPLRSGGVD